MLTLIKQIKYTINIIISKIIIFCDMLILKTDRDGRDVIEKRAGRNLD